MKDKGFYVYMALRNSTEDNFELGERGETETTDCVGVGVWTSIEKLAGEVGLTSDLGAWFAFDNRLMCSQMEDEDGLIPSPREYEKFKVGDINLWAVEYNFYVQFIEGIYTPSEKEVAKRFGIEEYG